MKRILITGGCGFVGSNIAIQLSSEGNEVTCLDNLSRRGSEIILKHLAEYNCKFIYGDIRNIEDLQKITEDYEIMIECSAEPSVLVGTRSSEAKYLVNNNLVGALNCFEFCRERNMKVIFLSTSRVYPYDRLNNLCYEELDTRFTFCRSDLGISKNGIKTDFPLVGYRTLYGATKLAAEYILIEYSKNYGVNSIIDRCGVISGPWQLGKNEQGVFSYWLIQHYFNKVLRYIGYGGKGKQVRDILHIRDFTELIKKQINSLNDNYGSIFNVGGGINSNLSLMETTQICEKLTNNKVISDPIYNNRPGDVIWYISDNEEVESKYNWKPLNDGHQILMDIFEWLKNYEGEFKSIFGR